MERVIFGDNQFFAVNHMSEDKARAQGMRFQDIREIIRVLDCAYDSGIRAFMCTTHDRIREICDHIRANPERYVGFQFYPCMPYAHKYANAVTEYGIIDAVRRFVPEDRGLLALIKGGVSLATKDIDGVARLLIDAEMKMFSGLPTPIIFMQNVVADLLLGLRAHSSFRVFADHVREKYGAEPGFITMNLPRMLEALDQVGIEDPIVCCNINKIGFRMCGGRAAYEKALAEQRFRPVAMSVLASGAIAPHEAVEYVFGLPNVASVVFGASSKQNISEMTQLIAQLRPRAAA